jgi:hypothetical protein
MILTVILLLIFLIFALRVGVSYVVQYRANTAVYLWQQSLDNRPTLNEWQDTLGLVETMLAFDDKNPELLNVRGRLYFYRARNMAESVKKSLQDYKHAMVDYRAVIALRPAWPHGYLNLLYSKMLANEVDAEMRHSLLSLIKLAPWEKATLIDTVKAAVFAWASLDVKGKQVVKSYLLSVSDKRKGEVRLALSDSHYQAYFCKQIVKGETVALCQ